MDSTPVTQFIPATPADAALIRDIVRAAYKRWVAVIGREPMPMRVDYEKAVTDHRIELLSHDGLVVGVIETMLHDDHLWVENIAISLASRTAQGPRQTPAGARRRAGKSSEQGRNTPADQRRLRHQCRALPAHRLRHHPHGALHGRHDGLYDEGALRRLTVWGRTASGAIPGTGRCTVSRYTSRGGERHPQRHPVPPAAGYGRCRAECAARRKR